MLGPITQQCDSATSVCVSPATWNSLLPHAMLLSRSSQGPRFEPLSCSTFSLASFSHMAMCVSPCYPLSSPRPLLPAPCPQACPLRLHLYSCPANRFKIFLVHPCISYCTIQNTCHVRGCQIFAERNCPRCLSQIIN